MTSITKYKTYSIAIFVFGLTLLSNTMLVSSNSQNAQAPTAPLPISILKVATLGYSYFWSNFLWMQTVSYFGEHQDNVDYTLLTQKLHAVIALNPYAEHAYYMAASTLPWGTGNTDLSKDIVQQAIHRFPDDWRWPYYRGFNAYWFEHDLSTAAHYLSLAASIHAAPPIIASIAAKIQTAQAGLDTALVFLDRLIREKQDPHLRQQLMTQKKALLTEKSLRTVDLWLSKLPHPTHDQRDLDR
ncbi:MAG: hypothetical protein Q9M16_00185, partial [Mariprofundus sp.]|nr:hypothetical protein [Mariprofundus sp.]